MRVAFLSDIHANLPALEAALRVVDHLGAERIFVAGDLVGDGPHPAEVVAALRNRDAECIRGNVDRDVLALATSGKKLGKLLRETGKQKSNRAWTALRLRERPDELAWLAALPAERRVTLGSFETLVVHGSPRGDTDYLYPSLTPAALAGKLEPLEGFSPDVLVCGHSHVPFARRIAGVLVLNGGSVGRPADGDPRGTLAIVDFPEAGSPRPGLVRFAYPVDDLLDDLTARAVPAIDPQDYRLGVKR